MQAMRLPCMFRLRPSWRESGLGHDYGDPLAIPFFVIGKHSPELLGYLFGREVAMVAEEFFLRMLPCLPVFKKRMWRLVLGGENQGDVEALADALGQVDLGR